jgi:histidinol dehydrogenase
MKWMQTAEQSAEEIIKQLTPSLDEKEAESVVQPIIEAVRSQGDAAVRAYTQEFDGVDSAEFYAPQEARKEAAARLEKEDPGDNRLISPKSSHRRGGLAPRCRLVSSWG